MLCIDYGLCVIYELGVCCRLYLSCICAKVFSYVGRVLCRESYVM